MNANRAMVLTAALVLVAATTAFAQGWYIA